MLYGMGMIEVLFMCSVLPAYNGLSETVIFLAIVRLGQALHQRLQNKKGYNVT